MASTMSQMTDLKVIPEPAEGPYGSENSEIFYPSWGGSL